MLTFVVRINASNCLEDHLRNDYNVSSGTLNLTHSLMSYDSAPDPLPTVVCHLVVVVGLMHG